jgi:hypothetical protein
VSTAPPPIGGPARTGRVTIGDIVCTDREVVTPSGTYPLRRTTWMVSNNTTTTETLPTWAIVLAIILFFVCLLGLLFLLVKERRTTGYVQVSVQGEGLYYATQVPVVQPAQVTYIEQQVNQIRSLVAALG